MKLITFLLFDFIRRRRQLIGSLQYGQRGVREANFQQPVAHVGERRSLIVQIACEQHVILLDDVSLVADSAAQAKGETNHQSDDDDRD
jgi:hypothetical protein